MDLDGDGEAEGDPKVEGNPGEIEPGIEKIVEKVTDKDKEDKRTPQVRFCPLVKFRFLVPSHQRVEQLVGMEPEFGRSDESCNCNPFLVLEGQGDKGV